MIHAGVTGIFHQRNPIALCPWGRLSLFNRKEYEEYFLGGKGGHSGLTILPVSCADCHEIWEPQPPGTL